MGLVKSNKDIILDANVIKIFQTKIDINVIKILILCQFKTNTIASIKLVLNKIHL